MIALVDQIVWISAADRGLLDLAIERCNLRGQTIDLPYRLHLLSLQILLHLAEASRQGVKLVGQGGRVAEHHLTLRLAVGLRSQLAQIVEEIAEQAVDGAVAGTEKALDLIQRLQ